MVQTKYCKRPKVQSAFMGSKHWCRRRGCRGCKRTPKSFDLLKIWAKSLKIWAKSLKIWAKPDKIPKYLGKIFENLSKNGAQRCLTSNMAPNICRKTSKDHFLEATPKNGRQNVHDNFLGKFGKGWAKILCTPKNSLAPTPMGPNMSNEAQI